MNIQNRINYLLSKGFKKVHNYYKKDDIIITLDFIETSRTNFFSTVNLSLHKGYFTRGSTDSQYEVGSIKSVKHLFQANTCNRK